MKKLRVDSLPSTVYDILAVELGALSLDAVIDLMRCFPYLERVYIEVTIYFVMVHGIQCSFDLLTVQNWLVLNCVFYFSVCWTRENQLLAS
jgi:hypothetical protein